MPYHHDNNNLGSQTNAAGELAPPGFHYMPDGSLMADADMPDPFSDVVCRDIPEIKLQPLKGSVLQHCWSVCNVHSVTAGPGYSPMWVPGPYMTSASYPGGITFPVNSASYTYGGFAFPTNPLNPPSSWWNPGPAEYNAFYDWVVSQVGSVSVGDTVVLDMSMNPASSGGSYGGWAFCNILGIPYVDKICFKYEGQYPHGGNPPVLGFDNTSQSSSNYIPTVTADSCCRTTTPSFDCLDCNVVIVDGNQFVHFVNPILGTSISLSVVGLFGFGTGQGGELAKRGNKFWKKMVIYSPNSGIYAFREFEIGPNCLITHVRDVPFPNHLTMSGGNSMCATTQSDAAAGGPGAQVLTIGSVSFPTSWLMANGYWYPGFSSAQIAKVGLPPYSAPPGTPAYCVPIHPHIGSLAGDIVYVPSDNSHVTSETIGTARTAVHYDSTGTVLGTALIPGTSHFGMFSYEDDVYINTSSGSYKFDLTTHTISLSTMSLAPWNGLMDAASSPDCISIGPPCDFDDMMNVANATVFSVYLTSPFGSGGTSFANFTANMWDHYVGVLFGPTGCDWWLNRWTHWSNQLAGLTNPYQIALKTAKIDFAYQMITACDCDDPNVTSDDPDNVNSYNCMEVDVFW